MATQPVVATGACPKRGKKYFTVEEANRALKYVEPVVEDLDAAYRQAMVIRQSMENQRPEDDLQELRQAYEVCMERLNTLLDELHLVGVEFKDFDLGLLDFPAIHEGREVCLCWKRGEKQIVAWHEAEAGYAGRQEIGQLSS